MSSISLRNIPSLKWLPCWKVVTGSQSPYMICKPDSLVRLVTCFLQFGTSVQDLSHSLSVVLLTQALILKYNNSSIFNYCCSRSHHLKTASLIHLHVLLGLSVSCKCKLWCALHNRRFVNYTYESIFISWEVGCYYTENVMELLSSWLRAHSPIVGLVMNQNACTTEWQRNAFCYRVRLSAR